MLSLGAAVDLTLAEHVHAAAELALEKNRHDCGEASWLRVDAHTTTDTEARTHTHIPHTTHTKAFVSLLHACWSARKHHHTSTRVNSHQRERTSRWELRGVTEVVEEVRVGMRHDRHYSQVSVCRAVTLSQGHTGTHTHTGTHGRGSICIAGFVPPVCAPGCVAKRPCSDCDCANFRRSTSCASPEPFCMRRFCASRDTAPLAAPTPAQASPVWVNKRDTWAQSTALCAHKRYRGKRTTLARQQECRSVALWAHEEKGAPVPTPMASPCASQAIIVCVCCCGVDVVRVSVWALLYALLTKANFAEETSQ